MIIAEDLFIRNVYYQEKCNMRNYNFLLKMVDRMQV